MPRVEEKTIRCAVNQEYQTIMQGKRYISLVGLVWCTTLAVALGAEVTLLSDADLDNGGDLGSISVSSGTGTSADPYLFEIPDTGYPVGLDLQEFKVHTDDGNEDSFKIDLSGKNLVGDSGGLSFETSGSGEPGPGSIFIVNVNTVDIGGIKTVSTANYDHSGDVQIGETNNRAGTIRIDYIDTRNDATIPYSGGDVTIYGNSDVRIENDLEVPGDINTTSKKSSNNERLGNVHISHDGEFSAQDILTYLTGDVTYMRAGHVTLEGDAIAGGDRGDCTIRDVDTSRKNSAAQNGTRPGDIHISGYANVTINNIDTSYRQAIYSTGRGDLTVTNVTESITVTGTITLDDIEDANEDGNMTLICGSTITLAELDDDLIGDIEMKVANGVDNDVKPYNYVYVETKPANYGTFDDWTVNCDVYYLTSEDPLPASEDIDGTHSLIPILSIASLPGEAARGTIILIK
jgi:hypothetical protein